MKKNKSFSSEFFVDVKSSSPDIKTDYEIFENKDKLDEIRSIIIQNIIVIFFTSNIYIKLNKRSG